MIFGVAMRTLFFALGLVATLVGCGRTPPATLDGSVTNTAAPDASTGNGRGGAAGAGGTWRGTGGSATTSGTGGVLGNGGATPPTVGTGGRPAGTGGATPPTVGTGGQPAGYGGSIGCPATPGDAAINFCTGRAQGAMTGWGWVALGALDTLTSPRCDGASEPITRDNPCLATVSSMLWSSSDALCVSGSLPVVTGGDYTANWGIMVGCNASEPEGTAIGKTFSRVTFTWQGTVVPTNTAIRGILHRRGDPSDTFYCATVQSGRSIPFEAFNTKCWDRTGVDLTAQDVPSLDKMAVQISSDDRRSYTVTDFCVTGVTFEGAPPAVCSVTPVSTKRAAADVLLVLDRSGSMADDIAQDCSCLDSGGGSSPACPDPSTCKDRWGTLSSAVTRVVASTPDVRWALKLFSTPGGTGSCDVSNQVEVPLGAASASAIESTLQGTTLAGGTPTQYAVRAAAGYLRSVTDQNSKFILLATDGEPNCRGSVLDTPDIDGAIGAIKAAQQAGYPVYVVGIGRSVGNLDSFATAGGTGQYYPATSPDELAAALSAISKAVASCTFLLGTTPSDADGVAVYLDKSLIAKDDINGWSFANNRQAIRVNGASCAKLTTSPAATVTVLVGCPDEPFPSTLP